MDIDDFDLPDLGDPAPGRALHPREKAALIVSLALSEGVELPLQSMPRGLQEMLARQIASLGPIDETALAAVISEFDAALSQRVGMPSGSRAALKLLEGKVDPEALAPLREGYSGPDPWARISAAEAEALLPLVAREADEVAATIISRLPTDRAATVLAGLPGPQARRIAFGVSRIAAVEPELMRRLGEAILAEIEARPPEAVEGGAHRRVGAILNAASSRVRDGLLEGLREVDAAFADAVRSAIFTFADIETRLETSDVGPVMRSLDDAAQAAAIATAQAEGLTGSVEHLLGAMPKRMAEKLREAAEAWSGSAEDGEAAMAALCEAIRLRAEMGQITLRPPG
jgi:flagellar motor switch protein FliG